ncbi:LysR family transcriptional regulator [Dongia deserti]|uniref:LysR family transcriptional regulator n=1 Tax=Dongia deserti TaxID=2268030 RepID=UPI000E65A096|nr:LysR substrate-binding domain-containing protein [Dongia deserti]
MSIELRHLRAFVAVAEELNFRRASERLHVAQPALSRTIRDLEDLMGVTLFERSTRVVRLTPAAMSFLTEAREILDHLSAAVRNAQRFESGEMGSLTVGFNDFAINDALPPIVMRFRTRFPNVNIDLRSMTSPEMAEAIRKRRLDIGFLTGAHLVGDLPNLVLRRDWLVCLVPRNHPLTSGSAVSLSQLAQEPFVMGAAATWGIFHDVVNAYCMSAGFRPRIVQEAAHSDGIVNLVAAGVGISIYIDARWVRARRDVVMLPFVERPPLIASLAAWHPDLKSKIVENFVGVTRTVVAASSRPHRRAANVAPEKTASRARLTVR